MNLASELHNYISKVCPIDGVSIGNKSDPSTWRPQFKEGTTDEQKKAANEAVMSFDSVKREQVLKAQDALLEIDRKSIRAIREYIASKPDAPAVLKTHESEAAAERGKLK